MGMWETIEHAIENRVDWSFDFYKKEKNFEITKYNRANYRTIDYGSEYKEIYIKLQQLKSWKRFNTKLLSFIINKSTTELITKNNIRLEIICDKYYDKYYSEDYKKIREKEIYNSTYDEEIQKLFLSDLKKDFFDGMLMKCSSIENIDYKTASLISEYLLDIKHFVIQMFDKDVTLYSDIDLIKFIKDEIFEEKNSSIIVCSICKQKTYGDFSFCLNCFN